MNHFFRLLYVSLVLLFLMGLNEKQRECASSLPVSVNLTQQDVHVGILPAEVWITSEPNIPPVCCPQAILYPDNNEQRESTNSRTVQTRIICCCGEFKEHLPDMAWKTGQFLHFQASREVPPQS